MKTKQFLALLALIVLTNACGNVNKAETPPALTSAVASVSASLDSLSNTLSATAAVLAQVGADTAVVRSALQRLCNEFSFGSEFVFTTPEGILLLVEPAVYYPSQGSDISAQAHIIKAFETKLPALSDVFSVVEGYQAVVQIHPILAEDQLLGGVSGLFSPAHLIARNVVPIIGDEPFQIWVMEKTGVVLYHPDASQIGLNVFTDPSYESFPKMRLACEKIADEPSGTTSFSCSESDSDKIVKRKVFWETLAQEGNEWKFIWSKASR
ncbi:MAG: hypothetical protein WC262_08170 [Bacteroidales bacterium]|jgi:hypothetical protein